MTEPTTPTVRLRKDGTPDRRQTNSGPPGRAKTWAHRQAIAEGVRRANERRRAARAATPAERFEVLTEEEAAGWRASIAQARATWNCPGPDDDGPTPISDGGAPVSEGAGSR